MLARNTPPSASMLHSQAIYRYIIIAFVSLSSIDSEMRRNRSITLRQLLQSIVVILQTDNY